MNRIQFTQSSDAYLIPFILDNTKAKSPFILVVPGGGYNHYGTKEQETIAQFFNSKGFSSAVLYYTLSPFKFPDALVDLAQAVAFIRQNADKWNIDSQKICLCGFSAGGHLCASLGCYYNSPLLKDLTLNNEKLTAADIRADSLCLCYPVISADKKICHEGSIKCLTENLTQEECLTLCKQTNTDSANIRDVVSLEKHVSKDFPKTFMWHTRTDKAVPAENTLRFAQSLKEAGVDFEYHLFKEGDHGLALAEGSKAEIWTSLFLNWNKD